MRNREPKKLYQFHFAVTESDGDRFHALVARLQRPRADIARDALLAFLVIADSAPVTLQRHSLAAFIECAVSRIASPEPDPAVNGSQQKAPNISRQSRSDTVRQRSKR